MILMLYILQDYFIQKEEELGRERENTKVGGQKKDNQPCSHPTLFGISPEECCYFGGLFWGFGWLVGFVFPDKIHVF